MLKGEAKKLYQREYMRRRRSVVRPVLDPALDLVRPTDVVRPVLDPVRPLGFSKSQQAGKRV